MTIITAGADANAHFDPSRRRSSPLLAVMGQVLAALFPVGAR